MELQVKEDYELDNLVKDWGFEKSIYPDFDMYSKESKEKDTVIKIFSDGTILITQRNYYLGVVAETLCLLYDLIQAGIIVKVVD